jgi:hypothetical protein
VGQNKPEQLDPGKPFLQRAYPGGEHLKGAPRRLTTALLTLVLAGKGCQVQTL